MRERRGQLFNKRRAGLLSDEDLQEALTEIVRQEFNNLATTDKSEFNISTKTIINSPLNQDEALKEESELIAEQGVFFSFILLWFLLHAIMLDFISDKFSRILFKFYLYEYEKSVSAVC